MNDHISFASKLAHNIGLIVLESQELERHLKVIAAASDLSATTTIIERHKKLERRSLGEVVKRFIGNVTITEGAVDDLENYFRLLLDRRNRVVHHFFETYAEDLNAERHTEILVDLGALHRDLREVARAFRGINEAFLESLNEEQPLSS